MSRRNSGAEKRKKSVRFEKIPVSVQKLIEKAYNYMGDGDFHLAKPVFLEIRDTLPDSPEILHSLGFIELETGSPLQAIDYLRGAVRIAPSEAEIWNLLGIAYQAVGRAPESIHSIERAIALNPNDANAHLNLAKIFSDCGNIGSADNHFKQAIAGMPRDYDAHIFYAEFLISNQARRQAHEILKHARGLDPEKPKAHFLSGVACAGLGLLEEALEHFYTVLRLQLDDPAIFKRIGVVLKAMESVGSENPHVRCDDLAEIQSLAPLSPEPDLLAYWINDFSPSQSTDDYLSATQKILLPQDEIVTFDPPSNKESEAEPLEPFEELVALLHWGRSGSGFFHSLVDGHPQVSTLPGNYLADFFGRSVWNEISSPRPEEMVEAFIEHYEVLFDATAKSPPSLGVKHVGIAEGYTAMGENRDQTLQLDREAFRKNLNSLLAKMDNVDRCGFFQSVHRAYEQTLGRHGAQTHIFYHIHNPDRYELFNYLRHVPESKILMTVREPIQNFESTVSVSIDEGKAYEGIAERIAGFLFVFDRPFFHKFPSRGVRLEDLKFETAGTLDSLCQWLGIRYDPALEQPTFQGLKWWGDPSTKRFGRKEPVIGFAEDEFDPDRDPVKRKVGILLSERDQFILETLFYPVRVLYGYIKPDEEKFRNELKAVRPMLAEPFDFEQALAKDLVIGELDLERNASSRYLRNALLDRWETLTAAGTYPHLIPPLRPRSAGIERN